MINHELIWFISYGEFFKLMVQFLYKTRSKKILTKAKIITISKFFKSLNYI